MSCAVDHRHGSDLTLLWLIGLLAWEPPYAAGAALKSKKKKKKEKKRKKIVGQKIGDPVF